MFAKYKTLVECIEKEERAYQVAESLADQDEMMFCYNRLEIAYQDLETLVDVLSIDS